MGYDEPVEPTDHSHYEDRVKTLIVRKRMGLPSLRRQVRLAQGSSSDYDDLSQAMDGPLSGQRWLLLSP